MARQTVGLIGLGLMGTAIAQRLRAAGHRVVGFDVALDKVRALAELGVTPAPSVAAVASICPVVVLAVFTTEQVARVLADMQAPAGAGTRIVACTSTCDPDRVSELAAGAGERGWSFLEVPISGTSAQVARGEGVGLVAGDPGAAEAAAAVLAAICPRRHFLGAPGNAGRAKLAINLILGLNRAAIAEGLAFAERLGLDRGAFLEVAKGSAAYSQVMEVKGALWANDRYEPPMSRVDQSLKDFGLMLSLGQRVGQPLPFASLYAELMSDCVEHGEAAQDNAVVINAIRRRAKSAS